MNNDMMDEILFAEPDKINKVLRGEEEINDEIEIEDALLEVNRLERDVDFFKRLKKRRIEPLDKRMKKANEQIGILKEAILSCMKNNKTTKLDFPEVAKLSQRKKAGSWEIVDQEMLDKHLESLDVINDVAEKNWKYNKRKLTKLLCELNDNNNIPENIAKKGEDGTALVVSFHDAAASRSKEAEAKRDSERWQKATKTQSETKDFAFDALEV